MKNKFYQKVLKRIVMFVVLLVLLLPVVSFAQAEVYTIDLEDYNLPVWDLSGSYDTSADYYGQVDLGISITIVQDVAGKVTGSGYVEVEALGYYLDDIPVSSVTKFEAELMPFMEAKYENILEAIRNDKKISDDTDAQLRKAIEDFKASFAG